MFICLIRFFKSPTLYVPFHEGSCTLSCTMVHITSNCHCHYLLLLPPVLPQPTCFSLSLAGSCPDSHHPLPPGSIMKLRNAAPTAPTRRPRHPAPLLPFLPFSRPTDKVTAVSGDNPLPFASRVCVSRLDAWLAGPDEERSPGQRSPSTPKSFIQPGIPT